MQFENHTMVGNRSEMFAANICVLFNFKNDLRNRQQEKASRRSKILSAELLLDILVRSSISRNYLGT